MGRPVAVSNSRGGPPKPAVRNALPSGLNAMDVSKPECTMGSPMGRPEAASHRRAVLPPVVTMTRAEIVDSVGPTIQRYLGLPE